VRLLTSHWRSPLLDDVDAVMVGISRGVPRWSLPYRYRKLPALAPNHHAWAQEDQESFEASYVRQLEDLGLERVLVDLARISGQHGGKPLCLVCWERPHEPFCHRWTLSRWVEEQASMEVPELEAGMLARKPSVTQPPLF
jgi:hypothetical protein